MERKTLLLALTLIGVSCHKNNNNPGMPVMTPGNYVQTNLVSDTTSYGAAIIDPSLRNAWGIAVNPTAGIVWISANHSGATNVYDSTGKTLFGPVSIPSMENAYGGSPTGVVFNPTQGFIVPGQTAPTPFIFVNEDGTISAWPLGSSSTFTVVDHSSADAVYKGCALAVQNGATFLYAANFKGGAIEVFDKDWQPVTGLSFKDPGIPAGYGPFNIATIKGMLYVTYAKLQGPDNEDDQPGAGNGYVDVYSPDGKLVMNFAARGALNSPWGIAQAPDQSGVPLHSILIGNFGDGLINVYDSTGVYKGALQSNGKTIVIEGLWALDFPVNEDPKYSPNKLFFTAGPKGEQHGLFGYLQNQ